MLSDDQKRIAFEDVEQDFEKIVRMLDDRFIVGYSFKNPDMVKFLMTLLQQEKERSTKKS